MAGSCFSGQARAGCIQGNNVQPPPPQVYNFSNTSFGPGGSNRSPNPSYSFGGFSSNGCGSPAQTNDYQDGAPGGNGQLGVAITNNNDKVTIYGTTGGGFPGGPTTAADIYRFGGSGGDGGQGGYAYFVGNTNQGGAGGAGGAGGPVSLQFTGGQVNAGRLGLFGLSQGADGGVGGGTGGSAGATGGNGGVGGAGGSVDVRLTTGTVSIVRVAGDNGVIAAGLYAASNGGNGNNGGLPGGRLGAHGGSGGNGGAGGPASVSVGGAVSLTGTNQPGQSDGVGVLVQSSVGGGGGSGGDAHGIEVVSAFVIGGNGGQAGTGAPSA